MAITRETFTSRLGFILASAGSAVGIGNLVGFPVNATKNGGAAFLFIYALFVVFICLPVMLAEFSVGRHTQRNPIGAFRQLGNQKLLWNGAGWLAVITPFMIAVFYMVITLWVTGYLFAAATGQLAELADPDYFGTFINSNQIFIWLIVIGAFLGYILIRGVADGIEKASRLMMPALFIMLVGLVLFVLTLDNAMTGIRFYLIPDFSKLTPSVLNGALSQAFFSLSLGMGILITYGSYMKREDSIPFAGKMVALTDTSVAFLAGLMILPAIFSFNPETNTDELSNSSVSLIFTFLPKIFLALQASIGYFAASLVASIFFLLVLFAALTSQVSILQVSMAALEDELGYSRQKSFSLLGLFAGILCIFCILSFGRVGFLSEFVSYGGSTKSFFDLVVDIFYETILPLNGLLICLLVSYQWKKYRFDQEIEQGASNFKGTWLERYINLSLHTVIPLVLAFIFLNTIAAKFFGWQLFG